MRADSSFKSVLLVVAIYCASMGTALAQSEAEALKQKIQKRAQNIGEFRALLNDPDQTIRIAALDVMLKSDDIAMRELAFAACFNSADQAMRVVCLKNKIADLKTIGVKISQPEEPTEAQQKTLTAWGGIFSFQIQEYDEKTGQFKCVGSYKTGTGQVSGTNLVFTQQYCNGSFKLVDGGILDGEFGCSGSWTGRYQGRIHLQ